MGRLFGSQPILVLMALVIVLTGCARLPRQPISKNASVEPSSSASRLSAININTASAAEIERLPGIGPVLAERIVAHRQENGPFRRVEHLMMVRGISDRKFREIRQSVTVE